MPCGDDCSMGIDGDEHHRMAFHGGSVMGSYVVRFLLTGALIFWLWFLMVLFH